MRYDSDSIHFDSSEKTIDDLLSMYERKRLNLEPGFQRKSVWPMRDRRELIKSILQNYPLPSIFLYRRREQGHPVYDVIDGKQRIESILAFTGRKRGERFGIKTSLPGLDKKSDVTWNDLKRTHQQDRILGYKLHVIEVDGEFADIVDLFVRINSTGKPLTAQEKRHAKYYDSATLRAAATLARKHELYLRQNKILTVGQMERMKHVELLCELILSAHEGGALNKKAAIDRMISGENSMTATRLKTASEKVNRAFRNMARIFPGLKETRFHQYSDFYTLALLLIKFDTEGMVLNEAARNKQGMEVLRRLSLGIDRVRENQKKALGSAADDELYRSYLVTVAEGSDALDHRRRREQILRDLLDSLFTYKDAHRGFSTSQRRLLWGSEIEHRCTACDLKLSWENFTVDHIVPHSRGGRSSLKNAALMCRSCNSRKGNRVQPSSRRARK